MPVYPVLGQGRGRGSIAGTCQSETLGSCVTQSSYLASLCLGFCTHKWEWLESSAPRVMCGLREVMTPGVWWDSFILVALMRPPLIPTSIPLLARPLSQAGSSSSTSKDPLLPLVALGPWPGGRLEGDAVWLEVSSRSEVFSKVQSRAGHPAPSRRGRQAHLSLGCLPHPFLVSDVIWKSSTHGYKGARAPSVLGYMWGKCGP